VLYNTPATIVIYAPAHTTVPRTCYHENDNENDNDNDSLINVGAAIIQQATLLFLFLFNVCDLVL